MKQIPALLFLIVFAGFISQAYAATPIILHAGDTIVAEGDSLTYGQDETATGVVLQSPFNGSMNGRSMAPYPETLQKILKNKVHVENRGYPGDRTVEGIKRWDNRASGALAIIMYGTNDCWNFGNYPTGKISINNFKRNLKTIILRRQKDQAQIVLLTPPPLPNPDQDKSLEPYRLAVKNLGKRIGYRVLDTSEALKGVSPLWVDAAHLSVAANQKLAAAIAEQIQVK